MAIYDEASLAINAANISFDEQQKAKEYLAQMQYGYQDYHALMLASICIAHARLDTMSRKITNLEEQCQSLSKKNS